jgi:hypothetical protein
MGVMVEYKRELFRLDGDLDKAIAVLKEYREKYGELD